MTKTILITGSTDGLGLETAKHFAKDGHRVLLHGRSAEKLSRASDEIGATSSYVADLSSIAGARKLSDEVAANHDAIDVLINNAGVYRVKETRTPDGFDMRFMVNTIAPYVLTKDLMPLLGTASRVVNLSSAAQVPYNLDALRNGTQMDTHAAYAQSKLALTAWTAELAARHPDGPALYAVNPGSLLATTMVKEGFGVSGNDIGIGVDILVRASLSSEFDGKSGLYFDNDSKAFRALHPFAATKKNRTDLIDVLDELAAKA